MEAFTLDKYTMVAGLGEEGIFGSAGINREVVGRAVERFRRDMDMVLEERKEQAGGRVILKWKELPEEAYEILVEKRRITLWAGDELGFIYGLLFLSEEFMGILPFWFWNDQKIEKREEILVPGGSYASPGFRIRFRGWFVNDEVLISHWDRGVDREYPWEMVFEALLRLGGNMVIPGTDKNARAYANLASSMGLWVTHHHAEPLGAEMFARKYPDLSPSFKDYPELFRGLWEQGIREQKGRKIIWSIGFRGQGDIPFWESDPMYDTPQKRGELISGIMKEQYAMVKEQVENPVFCTNLYGEVMELYQQGYISVPEDIIMIWGDNGYGKMVSRRQGNHNPRAVALPDGKLKDRSHGIYYHVSFYDLQAANHITMLPNSMEFVEKELRAVYDSGIRQFWLVNSSNVKPHVYTLDFIARLWQTDRVSVGEHRKSYIEKYYGGSSRLQGAMAACFQNYFEATLPFGTHEDERAGEQFYNYVTRYLAHGWMKDGGKAPCEGLLWCAPEDSLAGQAAWYEKTCREGRSGFKELLCACGELKDEAGFLWEDSLLLQVQIHAFCLEGAIAFCSAYRQYEEGNLMESFYLLGQAAEWFDRGDAAMRGREHDKWKGFYANDCLADVKATAYCIRMLMGYVRNLGDGPEFYRWQREVIYSEEDRRVVLISNIENHQTNEDLYLAMKKNRGC